MKYLANLVLCKKHDNFNFRIPIIFLLVILIFSVYGQVVNHKFLIYDDQSYVQDNPAVLAGLTPDNIGWAFSTLTKANWHPLTWLSYMLDIQLFGPNPGAILLENVALHTINTILLFLLLQHLTGAIWRSATVATLFAIHPLHVESVAWISERKDVLSTLFWLLVLYLHARYAEERNLRYYILALMACSLGLMAKPMLVTLPLVMLLMDYWPLKRFIVLEKGQTTAAKSRNPYRLIVEKLPFLTLAAASCIMTVIAQTGAMTPLNVSSLESRIFNGLNSYVIYLGKMFCPSGLSPFYPFPNSIPAWQPTASALVLTAVTVVAFRERQRRPYLIVGWLWYLVTLIPVVGIVKVGLHAMADRYTYVPLIGIFIMLAWGVTDAWHRYFSSRKALIASTLLVLTTFSLLAWRQVSFWKDSATLFSHARDITENNYVASNILAIDRMNKGDYEEALKLFYQSIRQAPWFVEPYINQGLALHHLGRLEEAAQQYKQALVYLPERSDIHNNLGITLAELGRIDEAIGHFKKALWLAPNFTGAQKNLKAALELKSAANQNFPNTREK